MTPVDALAILGAGVAAGAINTVVGSGSLITFPTLLAVGYPAVLANVTNNVGLVPGSFSGAVGYRRELVGQRGRLVVLGTASIGGGLTGAVLLLALPGSVFERVIPALILLACLLVAVQPWLSSRLAERRSAHSRGGPVLWVTVYLTGVYGGYFGAAQGVILIALLSIFIADDLQRLNGAKNVLVLLVNGVAAVLFIAFSHVAWGAAALIAVGAAAGGQIGAKFGRRLPPDLLRVLIIVVGVTVSITLLV
jgi:uncharacterized protein